VTRPDGVTDSEWARATDTARQDRHRLARLVRSGRVRRDPTARTVLPLPAPPRNPTIRPNRKKKRSKR
jgi:hypothetical protein